MSILDPMTESTTKLVLQHLSKRYGGANFMALDDVSLTVNAGEVYGFLGANGAGKSTTIRTLLNFIQPTSGTATICGHDVANQSVEAKKYVGYLSGEVALYGKATGKQFFNYMCALQPLKHATYFSELVKRFDVTLDQPIETLSKGNRQKVGIVQAFMHEPDVLILDEPTSGLDPLMQEEFFKLLDETKARGAAVFLSSHNLGEAQRICDRVGIIKHGKLIREQSIDDLSDLGAPLYRVTLAGADDAVKLQKVRDVKFISQIDNNTVLVQPAGDIASALKSLSTFKIKNFVSEKIDLEDEFIKFYGDDV